MYAAPLRRAPAPSAASAARFEAEAAAAAERAAERCESAEDEAAALRGHLRDVTEERETLAHAADLARSANASLTVERDAAAALAAALELEVVDARDAAERLRAEKHAMQTMVACADAAVRHSEALSLHTLLADESSPGGAGGGDTAGDGDGAEGSGSGTASVGDLDAMTAEMQRKRATLETEAEEEKEEGDGDEGLQI